MILVAYYMMLGWKKKPLSNLITNSKINEFMMMQLDCGALGRKKF